jgi:hypothetical protein
MQAQQHSVAVGRGREAAWRALGPALAVGQDPQAVPWVLPEGSAHCLSLTPFSRASELSLILWPSHTSLCLILSGPSPPTAQGPG